MNVWGIDSSSNCGLAIWDTDRSLSSAHCEVIKNDFEGDYYYFAVQMGRKLRERVNQFGRPDLVVIEQGSESTQGTGIKGIIWSWNCIGAVMSLVGVYDMPIATIHPASWRKPFYGERFIPPQLPVMEKAIVGGVEIKRQVVEKGRLKFKNDWKAAAIQKCEDEGVTLPPQKTIAHNAAEAVGIAHSWVHAKIINHEFKDAFERLKANNSRFRSNTRPSADLFGATA